MLTGAGGHPGSPVSNPVVYRSNASTPSNRRKRPWNAPKNAFNSGSSAGLACTSMGILPSPQRILV